MRIRSTLWTVWYLRYYAYRVQFARVVRTILQAVPVVSYQTAAVRIAKPDFGLR